MLKKLGKKGKAWVRDRAKLKIEFQEKGITSCEICGSTYILSFHHRRKRRFNDPHIFSKVILTCARCHGILEKDKKLTAYWFNLLRGGE